MAKSAIRAGICVQCYQRPLGSESLAANVPRSCEMSCPLFINLDNLHALARRGVDPAPGAYEHAMRDYVCAECHASATAGDYCTLNLTRGCPLSRYMVKALDILEKLPPVPSSTDRLVG
jgi:hypothetical protein